MSITPRRTTPTFNPSLFKSPLFTIALADPFDALRVKVFADYGAPVPDRVNFSSVEDNDENMPDRATLDDSDECLPDQAIPNDSDDLPARAMSEYFVHQIIISVSEELEKHMNNEMKEGKERRMVLHEVDTDTFEKFLQWAYTGEYSLTDIAESIRCEDNIYSYLRLYVFAERFNIPKLKDAIIPELVYCCNTDTDADQLCLTDYDCIDLLIPVINYAFDHIPHPASGTLPSVLRVLTDWIGFNLEKFRIASGFRQWMLDRPDIAYDILCGLSRRRTTPETH